ncbi:TPA_asm: hypothetical protein [Porphyromonas phage phage030a_KCOM2803]|uniref:Uncharacterized protein n=3 Tax=Viruses TaxID=10239 RepID=A0AAT9JDL6_9CAUD
MLCDPNTTAVPAVTRPVSSQICTRVILLS